MIQIDQKRCISCGACVVICPVSAIRLRGGTAVVDPGKCVDCARCVCKCYARAIKLREEKS